MRKFIFALVLSAIALPAVADDRFPPVTNETVKRECGACHLAFQPILLPQRSWEALMGGLSDHFGESAKLDEGDRREILGYLTGGAADVTLVRAGVKMMRQVKDNETPLRITELPRWRRKHSDDDYRRMMERGAVKSNSDCAACHPGADQGYYDDDDLDFDKDHDDDDDD